MIKTINDLVMKKRNLSVTIVALLLSLMVNSCKKDEPNDATNGKTTAVFNPNVSYGTMTDQDGNEYKTVVIGTQTWMAENLRTTKYRDGTAIPNGTGNTDWIALTTGAYCTNNYIPEEDPSVTYGRLYNWYAVSDSRNIAPEGWHVPTNAEWVTLITYLGGENVAGGKMKETGTTHWATPNGGATNESGFTALLAGGRFRSSDEFIGSGYNGFFWSLTAGDFTYAFKFYLDCSNNGCVRNYSLKTDGLSLRLIKD